jgi:PAS domain S-box-containing protein
MQGIEPPDFETFRLCYRLLFENARDGVLLVDESSRQILEANPAVQQLLARPSEEFVAREFFDARIFREPAIIRKALEDIWNVGPVTIDDTDVYALSGSEIAVNFVAHPLRIGEQSLIHVKIRDITTTKALDRANESHRLQLEWSNRELNAFAHIASHDLQEPLRAIQAFGERLDTKYAEVLDDTGRDYLKRMRDSATRMRLLIHDLAAYAAVTSSKRLISAVLLNDILSAVVYDLEAAIQETGSRIEVGPLPTVAGDSAQLRQLFQNIIANAIKFRQPNVAPVIQIFALGKGSNPKIAEIVVKDNGIGFEQKYADRIFAPFQRLHSQRKYPGTGIGLAICRSIVDLSSGRISATSVPGEGTCINVSLPIHSEEPSAS